MINYELERLIYTLCFKSQSLADYKSWTSKLSLSGAKFILKKIGEESFECIISIWYEQSVNITRETTDLIYHIFLLIRGLDLSYYIILDLIKYKTYQMQRSISFDIMVFLILNEYNYIADYCNITLHENVLKCDLIALVSNNLHYSILKLITLSVELNNNTFKNINTLYLCFYEIMFNIILLLKSKHIPYHWIINEVITRIQC